MSDIRHSLQDFAGRMESRLQLNEARAILPRTKFDLLEDLRLCCIKLEYAVAAHANGQISPEFLEGEAADVANFAFIIAEECSRK